MRLDAPTRWLTPTQALSKRREHFEVTAGAEKICIRDQAPLYEGNVALNDGWSFSGLILSLNSRVFFWPGDSLKPIQYGLNHFARYAHESPAIIRIPTADILELNGTVRLQLCKYNSGAPRCNYGIGSPRGPSTFVAPENCDFSAGVVREVTFLDFALLPKSTSVSDVSLTNWRPL